MENCEWHVLNLDFTKRSEDNELWTCLYNNNGSGISAKKDIDKPKSGFTTYTYKYNGGGTFTLITSLGGGHNLRGVSGGNILEVAVYYWNGNVYLPILLGIKKSGDSQPKYYSYWGSEGQGNWKDRDTSGRSLEYLLDDQNCRRNYAVPVNLNKPEDSSQLYSDKNRSNCLNGYRKIEPADDPPKPPGDEYTTKAYKTQPDTKISRVTYNGTDIKGIDLKGEKISNVRVYSQGNIDGSAPLMLQFIPQGTGNSKWYYSTNKVGTSWQGVIGTDGFYNGDRGDEPTEKLTTGLDDVRCFRDGAVTMDLTKSHSEALTNYCCTYHRNLGQEKISVSVGSSSIPFYKHHIDIGTKLAGIKYYEDGQSSGRKNIKLSKHPFPIQGSLSVYAFYCNGNGPVLIYVQGGSPAVDKWFKKPASDNQPWERIHNISKDPENIKDCTEKEFTTLVGALNDAECHNYSTCTADPVQEPLTAETLAVEPPKTAEETHTEQFGMVAATEGSPQSAKSIGLAASESVTGTTGSSVPASQTDDHTTASSQESQNPQTASEAQTTSESSTKEPLPAPQAPTTAQAEKVVAETAAAVGIWSISGISSGTLAGAGATFFGGWKLYNRYKGDPWIAIFSSLLFGVFTLIMCIDQVVAIRSNRTPIDKFKKIQFNRLGFAKTLVQVFGSPFSILWLVPVRMSNTQTNGELSTEDFLALVKTMALKNEPKTEAVDHPGRMQEHTQGLEGMVSTPSAELVPLKEL